MSAKHATADRASTSRSVQPPATTASTTKPQVSYQGHTTGPRTTNKSRLQPRASTSPWRFERRSSPTERTAASPRPTAREIWTSPAVCPPRPRALAAWPMASPSAVAGSSQETTVPGLASPVSQCPPRFETALITPMSTTTIATAVTTRGTRWRQLPVASCHHHPMKMAPISAGSLTWAARAHSIKPASASCRRASAQPATSRPSISASLWAPPTSTRRTRGLSGPKAKATLPGRPIDRAREGTAQAINPRPTNATRRKPATAIGTSCGDRPTIAPESRSHAGP